MQQALSKCLTSTRGYERLHTAPACHLKSQGNGGLGGVGEPDLGPLGQALGDGGCSTTSRHKKLNSACTCFSLNSPALPRGSLWPWLSLPPGAHAQCWHRMAKLCPLPNPNSAWL